MRRLLVQVLCISQVLLCAGAEASPLSEDALEELSAEGERFIHEEIKRAVLGVKRVKELMEEKEEKHRHFMEALRQSSDKKKGAMQLSQDTEQKLEEAERQCQDLTKSSFEECWPCLEETCKDLYAATCRRGFTSFSSKVEDFFKTLAAQLEDTDHYHYYSDNTNSAQNRQVPAEDSELQQLDASFSELLSQSSVLFNRSVAVVRTMQPAFGNAFLSAFTSELHPGPSAAAAQVHSSPSFLGSLGLDHIVDSMFEFGRSVMGGGVRSSEEEEERDGGRDARSPGSPGSSPGSPGSPGSSPGSPGSPGSAPALGRLQSRHLCTRLRRQTSECLQLQSLCDTCREYLSKECPIVQQLQSDVEEMHTLLNASSEQLDDRLQLVLRHTADARRWLNNMEDKYRWVSRLSRNTEQPQSIFSVITVTPQQQVKNVRAKADSSVVVTVMGFAPITVSVPADLEVDDPAFIRFAAQEALTLHKRQIRGTE